MSKRIEAIGMVIVPPHPEDCMCHSCVVRQCTCPPECWKKQNKDTKMLDFCRGECGCQVHHEMYMDALDRFDMCDGD